MSYRFDPAETVPEAFARCSDEQLAEAIAALTDGVELGPVEAIHKARKHLKKERALLRLTRASVPRSERRYLNTALRDSGRRLSPARDAEVLVQSLGDLSERYAGQVPAATFDAIEGHLQRRVKNARRHLLKSSVSGEVAEELRAARSRTATLHLRRGGWQSLQVGLLRTYRRGIKAFEQASTEPTDEYLHDWRKRAKDLWYQLRLLSETTPNAIKGHVKDADQLGKLLGDDHDLAVLRETLVAVEHEIAVDTDAVTALIDQRRDELQTEAVLLGRVVYAETPKAFVRRLHRYWNASHARVPMTER